MILVNSITKKYIKTNVVALDNVSVSVDKGKIVSLIGPNGSGKTTLIKSIIGLTNLDKGNISINGLTLDKNKNDYVSSIGVVLEGARNLYWKVSVKRNLYYFAALKGKSPYQVNLVLEKYENLLKMKDLLDRKVETLSLGQKQKVSIVSSIITQPKVLILDEPSNGLDLEYKHMIAKLIKYMAKNVKTAVLITSHDLNFINELSDEYIFLTKGRISKHIENPLNTTELEKIYYSVNKLNKEEFLC